MAYVVPAWGIYIYGLCRKGYAEGLGFRDLCSGCAKMQIRFMSYVRA